MSDDSSEWFFFNFDIGQSNEYNEIVWTYKTSADSSTLGAKVNFLYSDNFAKQLTCPSNCPMKREDGCIASKCIREYPKVKAGK